MTTYPFYKDIRMEVVKNLTILFCGRCEKEFLAKMKEGVDDPSYVCPACKVANKFPIKWRAIK
jgi:DNA-directed RNA polymerase subunit RPC12/RpoP